MGVMRSVQKSSQYFVYIVRCADGTFYTGKTNDIEKRLREHNGEKTKGAKYTRARRPVELVYFEEYSSNSSAMTREAEIKKLRREGKEKLIKKPG